MVDPVVLCELFARGETCKEDVAFGSVDSSIIVDVVCSGYIAAEHVKKRLPDCYVGVVLGCGLEG